MAILKQAGYVCTRSGGSLGLFDVVAIGATDIRLRQVKSGTQYLSGVEREHIKTLVVPVNVSRECWRFPDRCKTPVIERL